MTSIGQNIAVVTFFSLLDICDFHILAKESIATLYSAIPNVNQSPGPFYLPETTTGNCFFTVPHFPFELKRCENPEKKKEEDDERNLGFV